MSWREEEKEELGGRNLQYVRIACVYKLPHVQYIQSPSPTII